jgi:hypothetical protein
MAKFEGDLAKRRKERGDVLRAIYLENYFPGFARVPFHVIASHPLWIKAFGDEKPNPTLINAVRNQMVTKGEIDLESPAATAIREELRAKLSQETLALPIQTRAEKMKATNASNATHIIPPEPETFATREARDESMLRRTMRVAREFGEGRKGGFDRERGYASSWRFGIAGGMLTLGALEQLFARFEKRSKVVGEKSFPYSVTSQEILEWIESFRRRPKKAK